MKRLDGGNRHDVYKISLADPAAASKHLVVRISHSGDRAERAQAEREARVLQMVGGLAGPLLYDFRPTSQWFDAPAMCMDFVEGEPRGLGSAGPTDIERLGSVIRWVHGRPADDLAGRLGTAGDIGSYAQARLRSIAAGLIWVRNPLPPAVQARLRDAAELLRVASDGLRSAESFVAGEALALLHGDPGPGNILWGPKPVLIDWEYARLGDPADEIAYLFDQNGLSPSQREAFWRGYGNDTDSRLRLSRIADRVDWWEPVTVLGSALWWVERWVRRTDSDVAGSPDPAASREPGYYLDQVISRLERL